MSTEQVPNFVLSQNLQKICEHTLSLKDICWLLFTLNDINLTTLQIYNHYNTRVNVHRYTMWLWG